MTPTSAGRRAAIILGASAGVGRALAAEFAAKGWDLVLVARDSRDLEATADDLEIRHGGRVLVDAIDINDPQVDATAFIAGVKRRLGRLDAFLAPCGQVDDADDALPSAALIERLVRVNQTGLMAQFAEAARLFQSQGHGVIVGFSSIAAAAPRGKNMVYSASKAGIETFLLALRHHLAPSGARVQIYAPGYVDSAMSYGKKLLFPVASAESVAQRVARNIDRDVGLTYVPRWWRLITLLLRLLPWPLYRRLRF